MRVLTEALPVRCVNVVATHCVLQQQHRAMMSLTKDALPRGQRSKRATKNRKENVMSPGAAILAASKNLWIFVSDPSKENT